MQPLLDINALNAFYGDFQALYDVQLAISAGEVVAIVGANGAGKTTLLRSIAGLLRNESQSIVFNGKPIGNARADQIAKLGLALVPEGRQLFPSLSVEENLKLGATVGRQGAWNLQSVYALFPVLEERRNVASTQLSGGQQQMVAIGRALMANPDLIMFDEISLGLAPVIINSIYAQLPQVINQGTTAIIIEQDIGRALAAATRVYCLQEGRVRLHGRTDELSRQQITQAYFGVAA
ncbi:MAG: ABC transporter ATP-binding protein [Pseudomonadota bacterium]